MQEFYRTKLISLGQQIISKIIASRKVVIAAANECCTLCGGCEIALAHNIRIALCRGMVERRLFPGLVDETYKNKYLMFW